MRTNFCFPTWRLAAAPLLFLFCCAAPVGAVPINFTLAPSGFLGDETSVDLSADPNDSNDTAIRIRNLSLIGGTGSVELVFGPALKSGQTVEGDFVLLDNTLEVTTDLLGGEVRLGVRMEIRRSDFTRLGLRVRTARLLRIPERQGVWRRARESIVDLRSADLKRFTDRRADFTLGHNGIDLANSYVWSVIDVPGTYAIGALPVPEPAALAMIAAGAVLLLLRPRRNKLQR